MLNFHEILWKGAVLTMAFLYATYIVIINHTSLIFWLNTKMKIYK